MQEVPDEELMLRYAGGDAGAFEILYGRHKGPLYRYVRRQVTDDATAEELFQDIWTNLIRSRERYEVKAQFATWLYRMAHNRVVDWYRSRARRPAPGDSDGTNPAPDESGDEVLDQPDPRGVSQERNLAAQRGVTQLSEALAALPDEQREAFLLKEESGLSLEDIASVTGVGRETVKSRLRYAVARLRAAITWVGAEES